MYYAIAQQSCLHEFIAPIYSPLKVAQLPERDARFIPYLLQAITVMVCPFKLEMGPNIWAIYNK